MPGAAAPAALRADKMNTQASVTTGSDGLLRHSPRDGLTDYFVITPVRPGFVVTVASRRSKGLAPASGRQDHTTSPYALTPPVSRRRRVHRIPTHARDVANAPQ